MTLRISPRRGVAAGIALALALAACSSGGSSKKASVPDVTGNPPVTLTVMAPQFPDMNLNTNAFSAEMSRKFNITFKWQTTTLDTAPAMQKRQISLASGDYPALYLLIPWVDQFSQADLIKLSSQGVVLPLNALIDKYGPHIKAALQANPEFGKMATAPDGKIYGIPQWTDCFHCSYQDKLWMNSAWLKKLGLKQPKTTDDMKKVLEAFKTRDPNGNGKADEIPVTGNVRDQIIPYFMNAFIYDPQGQTANNQGTLVLNNGKVDIQADKDGWRAGLTYLKSLYSEGLIDKGAFTQNPDSMLAEGNNASAVILGAGTVLHPGIFVTLGSKDGRDKQYDAVPPLTGPTGHSYTAYNYPSNPGATFVLTNKATPQMQVAAIKMLDYIFTQQGEIEGMFGVKGKGYVDPTASDVALDKTLKPLYKQVPLPPGSTPLNGNWSALAQYNNTAKFRASEAISTDLYSQAGYERRLFEATKLYQGHEDKAAIFPYWTVWVDPSMSSELATLQTNIESYVEQNALQFITGSKNIDTDWNSYLKGLNALGLTRYLQIEQQAYDKSKTK